MSSIASTIAGAIGSWLGGWSSYLFALLVVPLFEKVRNKLFPFLRPPPPPPLFSGDTLESLRQEVVLLRDEDTLLREQVELLREPIAALAGLLSDGVDIRVVPRRRPNANIAQGPPEQATQ